MDKQEFIKWLETYLANAKDDLAVANSVYNSTQNQADRRVARVFQNHVWALVEIIQLAQELNDAPVSPVADVNEKYQP